jgi:hypothetical protein
MNLVEQNLGTPRHQSWAEPCVNPKEISQMYEAWADPGRAQILPTPISPATNMET